MYSMKYIRNRPCSRPFARCCLAICSYLLSIAQYFYASWVLLDLIGGPVELVGFTLGPKYFCVEEIDDTSLY